MISIITVNTIFLQILNAFQTPDDTPVKDLQLQEYNTGGFLVMHVALCWGGLCQISALCATQKVLKKPQLRFPEASCRCLQITASSSLGCCSLWMFCPHGQECLFQFF